MGLEDISWLRLQTELTQELIQRFNDGPPFPINSMSKKGDYILSTSENGQSYSIEVYSASMGERKELLKILTTTRKEEAIAGHYSALDFLNL